MSLDAAHKWFDSHPHDIPAVHANISKIIEMMDEEYQTHNIVKYAVRDPGLILAILKKINANRGPESGLDVVESPQSALSMLGNQVTQTLFREFPIAENIIKDPEQIFLFQQIVNRSYHNQFQTELWGQENGFKQLDKLKLAALLAYTGELLCCLYEYDKYKDYTLANSTDEQAYKIFGFQFAELTEAVSESLNLPELISMLQPHTENVSQSSNQLHFTSQLCQRCEHGWYYEKVLLSMEKYSEYFQTPLDKVISKTHEFAVIAARESFIPEAWQPASRLLLIKDEVWKPRPKAIKPNAANSSPLKPQQPAPSQDQNSTVQSATDKIKQLVKKPNASQSEVLKTCVSGIYKDVKMGRVALFLLSKDKKHLHNRMSLGIDESSPFKTYQTQVESGHLFDILLKKPSAVWVNPDTIQKYRHIIPDEFLEHIHTDNFSTMSLFIGSKPVGIIYADRSNQSSPMNETLFNQFKQLITLSSKALTIIAKK